MKKELFSAGIIFSAILFAACSDTTGSKTNPVDSSNATGVSEVRTMEGEPNTPVDETNAMRDSIMRDTLGDRAGRTLPTGNGTNTSNTSDARTSSGSANDGDADKDRKK